MSHGPATVDTPATAPAAERVDKTGERIKRMFAGVAPVYDLLNHVLSLNIDTYWRAFTVRKLPLRGHEPVLDVCTGTGDLALALTRRLNGKAPVVGADFCPEMLAIARKKRDKAGVDTTFLEADTTHLPLDTDQFQAVTVAFGLRNVADTHAGLSEMVRVAGPGGTVAILEFSRPKIIGLRQLYLAYFKYILPRIGQWFSKSRDDAYSYLPKSVMQFPDGQEMLDLMAQHGLQDTKAYPLTFGIATLYMGTKPQRGSSK